MGVAKLTPFIQTCFAISLYSILKEGRDRIPATDISEQRQTAELEFAMGRNLAQDIKHTNDEDFQDFLQRVITLTLASPTPRKHIQALIQELNNAATEIKTAIKKPLPYHQAALALLEGLETEQGINRFFEQRGQIESTLGNTLSMPTRDELERFLLTFGWRHASFSEDPLNARLLYSRIQNGTAQDRDWSAARALYYKIKKATAAEKP